MTIQQTLAAALTLAPALLAQATGDPTAAAGTPNPADVEVQSVWDFVIKGGPVMIPIGICSLIAFTVVVERLISLRKSQVIPADFFQGLTGKLDNGATDRDKALDYCKSKQSPVANIFAAGIKKLGHPAEVIEKHGGAVWTRSPAIQIITDKGIVRGARE